MATMTENREMQSNGYPVQFVTCPSGATLAAVVHAGLGPTVLFCGGFNSDMAGVKASFLEQFCQNLGRGFVRFDYRGHGLSSGEIWQHTINDWIADTAQIIEQTINGKIILVGSSMGVWIMCHMIKQFQQRIVGCVGIAGAPDFTEGLLERLSNEQRIALAQGEVVFAPTEYDDNGYAITQELIDAGKRQTVLDRPIRVDFPVRLLHGTNDASVPWQQSVQLMETLQGNDIQLALIKGGDHRLSTQQNLELIAKAVEEIYFVADKLSEIRE